MIWQTRTLAQFVAATVPVERAGQSSPLLDQASAIGEPQTTDQTDERETAKVDPPNGSYEAFLTTFGNPNRWAGH